MSRPTKRENSARLQFRKRVPLDVLGQAKGVEFRLDFPPMGIDSAVTVKAVLGTHLKFSLHTKDADVAKARAGLAALRAAEFFGRIRRREIEGSLDLNKIARDIYQFYMDTCRGFPRFPNNRYVFEACMRARREAEFKGTQSRLDETYFRIAEIYPLFTASYPLTEYQAPRREISEKAVESRVGAITSWYLSKNDIQINDVQRSNLIFKVDRIANGFNPHIPSAQHEGTKSRRQSKTAAQAVTFNEVIELWKLETKPKYGTIVKWQKVLSRLKSFINHDDLTQITSKDLNRWKESLLKSGTVTNATIDASYFPAVKRLFSFAAENDLIPLDPAKSLKISVKIEPEKARQPYTTQEVEKILLAARQEKRALYRWLPWLAALTGARAGELTQAWASQVRPEGEFYVLDIRGSEDGGTIKNAASKRTVPLHPALIREGFLEFVRTREGMPLFYEKRPIDPEKIHPATMLVTQQGAWIKKLGLDHSNKSPNHAFRHWFKSVAVKVGIDDGMADALQGHAKAGEAAKYRHYDMKDLYAAICKIPAPYQAL